MNKETGMGGRVPRVLWAARDRDGSLYLYSRRPKRGDTCWYVRSTDSDDWYRMPEWIMPGVRWEDGAPRLVSDIEVSYIDAGEESL